MTYNPLGKKDSAMYKSTLFLPLPRKKITIWVHGTRGSSFLFTGITKEIRSIEHDVCTVPLGLHKATTIEPRYYQPSIAHLLSHIAPEEFSLDDFYIFGWSGKLNLEEREIAGNDFLHALENLVKKYKKKYGLTPEITIITHSHGGNVALNIAKSYDRTKHTKFSINRLILLACPVQAPTSCLITDKLFKQIYVLYSPIDQIQILDPQRLHIWGTGMKQAFKERSWQIFVEAWKGLSKVPLFSSRTFAHYPHIKQVSLFWKDKAPWNEEDVVLFKSYGPWVKKWVEQFDKKTGRGLAHLEFMLPLFLKRLPDLLHQIEQRPASSEPFIIHI